MATAKLISNVDLYFDLSNGASRRDKEKIQRCNVSDESLHHVLWRSMIDDLKTWKFVHKEGKS